MKFITGPANAKSSGQNEMNLELSAERLIDNPFVLHP
jgi:hypothetical protein